MSSSDRARILVVGQDFPWPATIGSHLRLAQVIDAAGQIGDVDLFCLVPARRTEPTVVPDEVRLSRAETLVRPLPQRSALLRLRWAFGSALPLDVDRARLGDLALGFRRWARPSYDAVWFSKASTYELLGRPRLGPTVVDLDDLEDHKVRGRRSPSPVGRSGTRVAAARLQARLDARRWHRLQRSVAGEVDVVVLCSELDATRAGFANCAVVPNGYREPPVALGRGAVGRPPTVLFAGSTCYGPNADAAHWLVSEIWPLVRSVDPGAVLRLVGEPGTSVLRLAMAPGVAVVGQVASMEPELARADVVVVPLRYGSGTRVKILEAFAHRIPVVSTSLGAEGLGALHGVHLLVADDPRSFAEACVALATDTTLRARLVGGAHRLFQERFRWESSTERVRSVLQGVSVAAASVDARSGGSRP